MLIILAIKITNKIGVDIVIIRLKGSFDKKEFLKSIEDALDTYVEESMTMKGSLYLNLFNEEGESIDYFDQRGNSLEITLNSKKKKKKVSLKEITMIQDLLKQGVEVDEISNILEIANSEINKTVKKIVNLDDTNSLPFIKIKDLDEYMFLESDVKIKNSEFKKLIKEIALYKNRKNDLEKVYSIREFCESKNLIFIRELSSSRKPYVPVSVLKKNKFEHLLEGEECKGIGIYDDYKKQLMTLFDLEQLLTKIDLKYFREDELTKEFSVNSVKGLKKSQIIGEESGYTITPSRFGEIKLTPVYDIKKLYKKYGIKLISDVEVNEKLGKTIFKAFGIASYYPNTYRVKEELEPYGFDLNGTEYHKLKKPLSEIFGLIEKKDILNNDFLYDPLKSSKLNLLLKNSGTALGDILPDGITEDFLLVYRNGKIDNDIIEEYSLFLKNRELKEQKKISKKTTSN